MECEGFVVAVAAVIVRDRRVLAMRRARTNEFGAGIWETCSGRLESGEDPLEAVAREVREETALEVRIERRPVDAYVMRRGESPLLVMVYRADWIAGEVRLSEEHDAYAWWTLLEIETSPMPERLAHAVRRALDADPKGR